MISSAHLDPQLLKDIEQGHTIIQSVQTVDSDNIVSLATGQNELGNTSPTQTYARTQESHTGGLHPGEQIAKTLHVSQCTGEQHISEDSVVPDIQETVPGITDSHIVVPVSQVRDSEDTQMDTHITVPLVQEAMLDAPIVQVNPTGDATDSTISDGTEGDYMRDAMDSEVVSSLPTTMQVIVQGSGIFNQLETVKQNDMSEGDGAIKVKIFQTSEGMLLVQREDGSFMLAQ